MNVRVSSPRRKPARSHRMLLEQLERRELLTVSNLLPTLAALQASTADVFSDELTLDSQQRVSRQAVNVGGEVDLYSFTPGWTATYRFSGDSYRSKMDPVIAVYDADGTRIALNDDASPRTRNSLVTVSLTAGTTYTFAVTSYDTLAVGRYAIGISGVLQDDAYENNDTAPSARVIQASSTIAAVLADAHDYYRFSLPSAAATGASVAVNFSTAQGDIDLRLLNSRGAVLRTSTGIGDQEVIDISGLVAGQYVIDVYGYRGAFNPAYQLLVSAAAAPVTPPVSEDRFEPNNTLANAKDLGTVTQPTTQEGLSISPGDVDFFTFSLAAAGGSASEVLLSFRHSQGDLDAELLDASGQRIALSQSSSNQERFSLTGLAAGRYAIRVYGYANASNPDYSLTINHSDGTTPIGPPVPPPPVDPSLGSWTVMVYMTATDLASFGFADVNEMEDALTRVAPGVRFTLFWDQWSQGKFATGGGSQTAWGSAGRAVLQADSNMSSVATTFDIIGERNSGDPATLRDFITWSKTFAPASNYSLVMWNHGGGLSGVNFDDESGNDSITINDLRSAITQAAVPLRVLSYDACLMGMVEVAYEARTLADVLVASEEVIAGPGFNYKTAFSALNTNPETVTAQALAQGIVASFSASYLADGVSTLSAVTSTSMDTVASSLKTFTSAATSLTTANVTTIKSIIGSITHFDFPEYVDLKQFMQSVSTTASLPAAVRTAATGVVSAVNQAVFSKISDARRTGGLATYLPSTTAQESGSYGMFSSFDAATGWGTFVNRVLGRASAGRLGAGAGLAAGALRAGRPLADRSDGGVSTGTGSSPAEGRTAKAFDPLIFQHLAERTSHDMQCGNGRRGNRAGRVPV